MFPIVFPANFPAPRPSKTSFWHLVRRKVRLCESKALEKAPAAGKSAIVRVFRLSRLARSHFSLQRRRFSRSEPGSQGRGDPKRPFRNPRLAKPPAGTPADASPGYVPQTYLTGASYERALRKREGKAQLAQRAKANRTPRGSIPWPFSRGRTMRPARSEEAFSSPALPGKTGRTQ